MFTTISMFIAHPSVPKKQEHLARVGQPFPIFDLHVRKIKYPVQVGGKNNGEGSLKTFHKNTRYFPYQLLNSFQLFCSYHERRQEGLQQVINKNQE